MSMEWKLLPKDDAVAQFPALYATLNPQGAIVISRSTHEKMGSPGAYVILFDPLRYRLGLKAANVGEPHAYPVRVWGKTGAKIVRAHRMIKEFGIKPPDTIEFPETKIVDDVLILDMQTARTSTRAHSQSRNRRSVQPAAPKYISPFPFVK